MKKFIIVLILFMSIVFVGCEKSNTENSNLIEIKDVKLLDNKDITVYFGRHTCPICSKFLPILESVVKDGKKRYITSTLINGEIVMHINLSLSCMTFKVFHQWLE